MIVEIHGLLKGMEVTHGTVESTDTGVVFRVDIDTETFLKNYVVPGPNDEDLTWEDGPVWVENLTDMLQGTLIWAEEREAVRR